MTVSPSLLLICVTAWFCAWQAARILQTPKGQELLDALIDRIRRGGTRPPGLA